MKTLSDVHRHFKTQAESQVPQLCLLANVQAFDLIFRSADYGAISAAALLLGESIENLKLKLTTTSGIASLKRSNELMDLLLDSYQ